MPSGSPFDLRLLAKPPTASSHERVGTLMAGGGRAVRGSPCGKPPGRAAARGQTSGMTSVRTLPCGAILGSMQRPTGSWRLTRVEPQAARAIPTAELEADPADVAEGARPVVPDFDAWVAARGSELIRFAYLVTGDRGRAEEAVQDALGKACGRWARICRADDPDAYVRRMVVNADISAWRRFGRRETPVPEVTRTDAVGPDIAQSLSDEDAMWRLCAVLPRRQRAAVVLRFYEDLPDAQIAVVLGCTESTVRSQIHRALHTLRAKLTEEAGRDG